MITSSGSSAYSHPEDQLRALDYLGLRPLCSTDPDRIAAGSFMIATWLVEHRSAAVAADLLPGWQEIVDALVVAGVTRLATYSE